MVWWKKILPLVLFLLIIVACVSAKETIIINSREWKDVYSGMIYGNLVGTRPMFLTSEKHSTLILNSFNSEDELIILTSKKTPFIFGYESTVRAKGYENVEERILSSLSLELAKELDTKNFIIIDDSYGYNAVSVAPYAMVSNSYILFADKANIVEVEDFLDERQPEKLLIYGHVDREVMNALEKFEPEIINEDGDRFANNVEIVKKYEEVKGPVGQVFLTNGEFIEESLISGQYPTLFIGQHNVPDKVREYVADSKISAGVLIGNDLVGTATSIRRQLGISVFVKFARSARAPEGPIAQVEDLDIFFVPKIVLNLAIEGARYNRITRQIEITYKNNADVATYFKGSYTLAEGDREQTFGDLEPLFIDANKYKTVVYDVEPIEGDATLDVYTIFGESKNSLEFALTGEFPITMIDMDDEAKITFRNVY
jgi:hypothetical protein